MNKSKYRVAQWGTGNVGLHALRKTIQHPRLELVALRVFTEARNGRDAGTLCGLPPNGVIASRGLEATLEARPDCVLYMPHVTDIDEMCRLLRAGINICTTVIGFHHRGSLSPENREKLQAACQQGEASLYSTGSSPGWITEIVPLALLALQRRLDCLTIYDYADVSSRNSPEMIFDLLGFGGDPAKANRRAGTAASTPPTFRTLAESIGLPLDDVTSDVEFATARTTTEIAAGTIQAGTVGAMRMTIAGFRDGKLLLRRVSTWFAVRDLEPQWALKDSGWELHVQGDTSIKVSIDFDVSKEDYPNFSPGLTAHPVINAAPYVCDAPPGILHTAELPVIAPYFGT